MQIQEQLPLLEVSGPACSKCFFKAKTSVSIFFWHWISTIYFPWCLQWIKHERCHRKASNFQWGEISEIQRSKRQCHPWRNMMFAPRRNVLVQQLHHRGLETDTHARSKHFVVSCWAYCWLVWLDATWDINGSPELFNTTFNSDQVDRVWQVIQQDSKILLRHNNAFYFLSTLIFLFILLFQIEFIFEEHVVLDPSRPDASWSTSGQPWTESFVWKMWRQWEDIAKDLFHSCSVKLDVPSIQSMLNPKCKILWCTCYGRTESVGWCPANNWIFMKFFLQ